MYIVYRYKLYLYIYIYSSCRFESTYQGTLRGYPTTSILTLKLFSIKLTIILLGNPLTFWQLA